MKKYLTPSIEVELISSVDIVTASVKNFVVDWLGEISLDD